MSLLDLPLEIYGEILFHYPTYSFMSLLTVSKVIRERVKRVTKPLITEEDIKEASERCDLLRISLYGRMKWRYFILHRLCRSGRLDCINLIRKEIFLPHTENETKRCQKKILGKAFLSGSIELVKYIKILSPLFIDISYYDILKSISIACLRRCIRLKKKNKDYRGLTRELPNMLAFGASYCTMDYAKMREEEWTLDVETWFPPFFSPLDDDDEYYNEDIYRMMKMAMKRKDERFFIFLLNHYIERDYSDSLKNSS